MKTFFKGPLQRNIASPRVEYTPIPANWFAPGFDDSAWPNATVYPASRVGPDGDYASSDFTGASFIWSDDIDLDNTVIFRYTAQKPPNYTKSWNADGNLDIIGIVSEARLAITPATLLYQVNADGLATGYLTRVLGAEQLTEQFAQAMASVTAAGPIDLGASTDQAILIP